LLTGGIVMLWLFLFLMPRQSSNIKSW
jgi:hypothetical protein